MARTSHFSDHFRNIAVGIAAILVPTVGYIYTNLQNSRLVDAQALQNTNQQTLDKALKSAELAKSYVELATSILKQRGTGQYDPVRNWAVLLINHYSDVKLSGLAQTTLAGQSLGQSHGYALVYYEVGRDGRLTPDGQLDVVPHQPDMPNFLDIKKGTFLQAASDIHLRDAATRDAKAEVKAGQCVETLSDTDKGLAVAVTRARSGGYLVVQQVPCPKSA